MRSAPAPEPLFRLLLLPFDSGARGGAGGDGDGIRPLPTDWTLARLGLDAEAIRAGGGFPVFAGMPGAGMSARLRMRVLRAGTIALPSGGKRAGLLVAVWNEG